MEEDKKSSKEKKDKFIKVDKKSGGAGDLISKLIKTGESKDDEALIDIKVTNPLHKIAQILQDIKNHQSTTVSLRFTIPLIALPIIILLAFQIGRSQTICSQGFQSKTGTIKNMYVQAPKEDGLFHFVPFNPIRRVYNQKDFIPAKRTVLISNNEETITVLANPNFDLAIFDNQRVVVTGNYSSCSQTITLDSAQNISLY